VHCILTTKFLLYGSWIYNYLCNQCLSPLMLWGRISIRERCTPLCDKVCQWLTTGRWFSPDPPVSSTNKTDHHDITEILLKAALNIIIDKFQGRVQLSIFHMRWRKRLLIDNHYLNSILKRLYFTLEQLSINISWILSIYLVCLMMFNAAFNNISVISWWSVLLNDEFKRYMTSEQGIN
jgi:hypothetical protein